MTRLAMSSRRSGQSLWILLGAFAALVIGLGSLAQPTVVGIVLLTVVMGATLLRLGVWRAAVLVSFAASVLRSGPFAPITSQSVWYALQFVPLIAACLLLATRRPMVSLRRADRVVLVSLLSLAGLAASSWLWSTRPSQSIAQAALLLLISLFLTATYAVRWSGRSILRSDITFLYWTVVGTHLVGVIAALLGASWAYGNYGRFQGILINPNYAGILGAIACAWGAWLLAESTGGTRRIYVVSLLCILGVIVWTASRGALIAVVLALAVLASRSAGRRALVPILSIGLAGTALWITSSSSGDAVREAFDRAAQGSDFTSGRVLLWDQLLAVWHSSPILGIGYRSVEFLETQGGLAAHNIYLSTLVELGLIGFTILATLLTAVFAGRARTGTLTLLVAPALVVVVVELTESSIFGFGGPTALMSWFAILCCSAAGRVAVGEASDRSRSEGLPPRLYRSAVILRTTSASSSGGTPRLTASM